MRDNRSRSFGPVRRDTPRPASTDQRKATAPYNFVQLPDKPLPSPMEADHSQLLSEADRIARDAFKDYIEGHERLSGEITLDIEALTPLFIGGNESDNRISFAPGGESILPGSSLRGMFKNIFKIVTCGAFRGGNSKLRKGEDFNDESIYYRCIMSIKAQPWTRDLNSYYSSRTTNKLKGPDGRLMLVKNARPGFLLKLMDGRYVIAPSRYAHDRKEDRIAAWDFKKIFPAADKSAVLWKDKTAYIFTGHNAKKKYIRFTSLDHVDWSRDHWFELRDELCRSYEHDRNRGGVDLFNDKGILDRDRLKRMLKNLPEDVMTLVPCHFLEKHGEVNAFGHGQCFRIPYLHRISDAVPSELKTDMIDFADAVFGRESYWASRVFFDDAKPVTPPKTLPTAAAHPLMQPNPTSYQLYLKQSGNRLDHWDTSGALIRGYKLYWHNPKADWRANTAELNLDKGKPADKRLTRDITPLDKGSKFKSKIRFNNLSAVELGALLMVFDLDGKGATAAYKLGQGKSFGFGSIKVKATLFIERNDAYEDLLDADGWTNPLRAEDTQLYLNAFKNYIKARKLESVWAQVMRELNAMLDWSKTTLNGWSERVSSMSGDVRNVDPRFKDRTPLPTIFDVLKG